MNTLQISPVVGVKPTTGPTGSPAGEAPHANPESKPTGTSEAPPQPDQFVAAREKAARSAEQRAAEARAAEARKAAQAAAEKALDLKVGIVSGSTGKVFVDIVDSKLNRTVARVFGPPNGEAPKHDAEAKAADAYSR